MRDSKRTTLAIDGPTFERLAELARTNERSASAEARVAIREHLQKSDKQSRRHSREERADGSDKKGA